MKDYKAECDKLRGMLQQAEAEIKRLEQREQEQYQRSERFRETFKQLLLDTLGSRG
jgi:hypothetical protein